MKKKEPESYQYVVGFSRDENEKLWELCKLKRLEPDKLLLRALWKYEARQRRKSGQKHAKKATKKLKGARVDVAG